MADALTPPFAVAALVVLIAAAGKVRAPGAARQALLTLGLGPASLLLPALVIVEVGLGGWSLIAPDRAAALALAALYGAFAAAAGVLTRRRAACGCFGRDDGPASPAAVVMSAILACVALAAALAEPGGAGWLLGRPAPQAAVVALAVLAGAYATIIAYTELPSAWRSWNPG